MRYGFLLLTALLLGACGGATTGADKPAEIGMNTLSVSSTWQWQLNGKLNMAYDVSLYDIDLFDTDKKTIAALHQDGRMVICYFSAGSYESWRDDKNIFPVEVLGNTLDGWEDERWLDIRSSIVREIMLQRMDLAKHKGCDGIEPDNIDGYSNHTGFSITADDQLVYNRFLSEKAHERGLLIGLKNDLEQIPLLVEQFDFAVSEQCHEYDECALLLPFTEVGKPVFNAEYASVYVNNTHGIRDEMCTLSREMGLHTLVLPLRLDDSFRYSCD